MTLKQYLTKHAIRRKDFAKAIKTSIEAVRLYIDGDRIPGKEVMKRIVKTTKGDVRANDFYEAAE